MKLKIMSDLHHDACRMLIPIEANEHEVVLIIAGDLCEWSSKSSYIQFFEHIKGRYKAVIYVAGNHEFYRGSFKAAKRKFLENMKELDMKELCLLDRDFVCIDDVVFIGATLWTSMNNDNYFTKHAAKTQMNDYRVIRTGIDDSDAQAYVRRLTPGDTIIEHKRDVDFIFQGIKIHKDNGKKVVVVTHHSPSTQSVHPRYRGDDLNWAYVTGLEDNILDTQPHLWIHGHVHDNFNYKIDQTEVICNPRGYARCKNLSLLKKLADDISAGHPSAVKYADIFNLENDEFDINLIIDTDDLVQQLDLI